MAGAGITLPFWGTAIPEGAHQGIVRIEPNLIEMPQAELAQICFEKAAQRSPIHRNAYMDRIVFSTGGVEHQFWGFTPLGFINN